TFPLWIAFPCPFVALPEHHVVVLLARWQLLVMMKSLAKPTTDCVPMYASPGVLVDCSLAPANIHDTEGAEEVLEGVAGFVLADRNYWKPELSQRLKNYGLYLLAPYKSAKRQKQPWP